MNIDIISHKLVDRTHGHSIVAIVMDRAKPNTNNQHRATHHGRQLRLCHTPCWCNPCCRRWRRSCRCTRSSLSIVLARGFRPLSLLLWPTAGCSLKRALKRSGGVGRTGPTSPTTQCMPSSSCGPGSSMRPWASQSGTCGGARQRDGPRAPGQKRRRSYYCTCRRAW